MKYTAPEMDVVVLATDIIMASSTFDPDNPSLGEEERE